MVKQGKRSSRNQVLVTCRTSPFPFWVSVYHFLKGMSQVISEGLSSSKAYWLDATHKPALLSRFSERLPLRDAAFVLDFSDIVLLWLWFFLHSQENDQYGSRESLKMGINRSGLQSHPLITEGINSSSGLFLDSSFTLAHSERWCSKKFGSSEISETWKVLSSKKEETNKRILLDRTHYVWYSGLVRIQSSACQS